MENLPSCRQFITFQIRTFVWTFFLQWSKMFVLAISSALHRSKIKSMSLPKRWWQVLCVWSRFLPLVASPLYIPSQHVICNDQIWYFLPFIWCSWAVSFTAICLLSDSSSFPFLGSGSHHSSSQPFFALLELSPLPRSLLASANKHTKAWAWVAHRSWKQEGIRPRTGPLLAQGEKTIVTLSCQS